MAKTLRFNGTLFLLKSPSYLTKPLTPNIEEKDEKKHKNLHLKLTSPRICLSKPLALRGVSCASDGG
jgi:hypothetical protein